MAPVSWTIRSSHAAGSAGGKALAAKPQLTVQPAAQTAAYDVEFSSQIDIHPLQPSAQVPRKDRTSSDVESFL